MAKLSISKASKEWGISRKTVQEAVKSGQLQVKSGARNAKNVDTTDLLRVFGEPKSGRDIGLAMSNSESKQVRSGAEDRFIAFLEVENKELKTKNREEVSFLQELIQRQEMKIKNLEEELAEYRKPKARKLLPWFGRS